MDILWITQGSRSVGEKIRECETSSQTRVVGESVFLIYICLSIFLFLGLLSLTIGNSWSYDLLIIGGVF